MSKRAFNVSSFTPAAQADGVLAVGSYAAMIGGNATMLINIMEVTSTGQNGSSAVNALCMARSSTLGTTPTTLALPNSQGQMNPISVAPATLETCYVAAATNPNRSSAVTIPRLNLSFNSFGSVFRWVAAPGEEWTSYGNAVNQGETVWSSAAVGTAGLQGLAVVYEVM